MFGAAVPTRVSAQIETLSAGKKATFNDRALPRKDKAKFRFRSDPGLAVVFDPSCPAASYVRVVTSQTAYAPIALVCDRWEAKGDEFQYKTTKSDPDPAGVRKIRYRSGRLDVLLKGENYSPNAVGGPAGWVETTFTSDGVEHCARWEDIRKSQADTIIAKGPTLPCQTGGQCANGIIDGDESDIDCGGSCPACSLGSACTQNSDCTVANGHYCDGGSCLGTGYAGVCETGNAPTPGGTGWMDSYAVAGHCWCDTTFDHGIGDVVIATPVGPRTIEDICTQLDGFAPARLAGDPIFNDIQCGNGPANTSFDEDPSECPGRVDEGTSGCCTIGPTWDLSLIE